MRGFPMSVALGRIAPGNACSIAMDDGIDEHTIVGGRTPDMALATGQKVPDPVPLVVAKSVTMHVSASHCRRPMSQRQTDLGIPEMTISQPKTRVLAPNVAKEAQLNLRHALGLRFDFISHPGIRQALNELVDVDTRLCRLQNNAFIISCNHSIAVFKFRFG
jgi:hypothetical protein